MKSTQKKMIYETIVGTVSKRGRVNFAPFGIKKNKNLYTFPYIPSKTLNNLDQTECASINYLNDSSFFVRCIIGNKNLQKKMFKNKMFFFKNALSHDEIVVESVKKIRYDQYLNVELFHNKITKDFKVSIVQMVL